jgi:uncharacterized protein YraI
MKRNHLISLFAFILLFATACSPQITIPPTAEIVETPTQIFIITATLPPTVTPFPTQTPLPPTATPIFSGVEGQTTSLVNVREAPTAASVQIGEVPMFDKIQIIGKDPSSKWWMIEFPASPNGQGWVTMDFVLVTLDTSRVPVVDAQVGAGQPAPVTEAGETASGATAVPTMSLATAPDDGDSFEAPAIDTILSETTGTYLEYPSELSAPEGDSDDWVEFIFDGAFGSEKHVNVIMNCTGSGKLNLELLQNGAPLQTWAGMGCERPSQLLLTLYTGAPYTLHFYTKSENDALKYLSYSVSVELVK